MPCVLVAGRRGEPDRSAGSTVLPPLITLLTIRCASVKIYKT